MLAKDGFQMKGGVRHIKAALLKEVSLVVFGANPAALITTVKNDKQDADVHPNPVDASESIVDAPTCAFRDVVSYL